MKFTRAYGNYYSENGRFMVERDSYTGWNLYTKSADVCNVYDVHVINCDTLRECKEIAQRYQDEADKAAAEAAAAELASIRTPGSIHIRAKADCFVGVRHVRAGQNFVITVYGDGTQAQPGNAYGKLYDFVTAQHAGLFEITARPEPEQPAEEPADLAAASERVHAATLASLAAAGVLAQEEQPAELVSVSDLADDLNTGDHGDVLCDYRDTSTYICDAIMEAADQRTSIYYSDILAFISEHPDALAEVIEEGLYDPSHGYDLYQHGQAAEFMMIERDLWNHLADNLMRAALCFIRHDLKRLFIPAELAELLRVWCNTAYQDERMSDIPDRIREYFDDLEGGADE